MAQGDPEANPPESPLARGRVVADRWTVGARVEVRGDLHVHRGAGEQAAIHLAAFRYRGTMPLPRFLRKLQGARDRWVHLRHGNLVSMLDGGRVTGETTCFWVQEDPAAMALSRRLDEHPMLTPAAALHIALQTALALREIHAQSAVHGDLDPANVGLLGANDRVRLGWPVLAPLLEHAGLDAGRGENRSLSEVAPEVLSGGEPDDASDRYALGALLFLMLAGEPPFLVRRGETLPGVTRDVALPPLPQETPKRVVKLLQALLQRDPARRPGSTTELVQELATVEAAARGRPVPPGSWSPTPVPSPVRIESEDPDTPPTAHRTLAPAPVRDVDSALSNVPASRTVTPAPPPSAAPRGGPDPRVWMLGGTVLLLTVLLFVVWGALWLNTPDPVAAADPAPAGTPAPVPEATPTPTPTPSASPAVLTLRTDPPGAVVWEGDDQLGVTPLEIVLGGRAVDEPRAFVLRRPGYAPHTVKQSWVAQDVQHTVPLQPLREGAAPRPPPANLPPIREER